MRIVMHGPLASGAEPITMLVSMQLAVLLRCNIVALDSACYDWISGNANDLLQNQQVWKFDTPVCAHEIDEQAIVLCFSCSNTAQRWPKTVFLEKLTAETIHVIKMNLECKENKG